MPKIHVSTYLRSFLLLLIMSVGFALSGHGQERTISGKISDANTGEPIPFANIYFKGTSTGTTSDFDGKYTITTRNVTDSLVASYIGYQTRVRALPVDWSKTLDFQLEEEVKSLKEVVFFSGENPAFKVIRGAVSNKKTNDKRKLEAYDYESYTKIQVSVDNISERFKKSGVMRKISNVLDSIEVIAGEDGKPVLPIFISEAISRVYFKSNPQLKTEHVYRTNISGVGITDGQLTSQVIGGTFQEYNFYQNWINIADKQFISPLADGWRISYEPYLVDSMMLGDHFCYKIDLYPKREVDLAFVGTLWITKEGFALKQLDLSTSEKINLNFIEKIRIQQEFEPTVAGPWMPMKTRVVVDVGEVTESMAGLLFSFYTSSQDLKVNEPQKNRFYMEPVSLDPAVTKQDDSFWTQRRHEPLSGTELNVYRMIDTLKYIPEIKTTTDLVKFIATGYHKIGKFEIGPYANWYANNEIEGLRLGFSGRTSIDFSNKLVIAGNVGYGFRDEEWKWGGSLKYIFDRKPWTTLTIEHRKEIDPVWVLNSEISTGSLFYAFSRFGEMADPFTHWQNNITFERQIGVGITQKIILKNQFFDPLFDFTYFKEPGVPDSPTGSSFTTTELNVETRFGRDEVWVINDNDRVSLTTRRWPVFILRYTLGISDLLGGDFDYQKIKATVFKDQKMGQFGTARFTLSGGYIFSQLPYPLLENHVGNESPFYIGFANNLMRYFEFSSDHWVGLNYRHRFQGSVLNRVPLLKKLKLRLTGTANILMGGMRDENKIVVPPLEDFFGNPIPRFNTFGDVPYVELGYGLENILKIIRVDFFHRLTYLDNPGVRPFGVKVSFQLIL